MKKLLLISVLLLTSYEILLHKESSKLRGYNKEKTELIGKVTVTMYNAVTKQCDATPLQTAGMYNINPKKASQHKWVAVSRKLLERWGGELKYGDKVRLIGAEHKDGVYTIVDTMNERWVNYVDILETKGAKWYKFENVSMIKV